MDTYIYMTHRGQIVMLATKESAEPGWRYLGMGRLVLYNADGSEQPRPHTHYMPTVDTGAGGV